MIKAVLIDQDYTIINADMLTEMCGLMGKRQESIELNESFKNDPSIGITPLITRFSFLKGLELSRVYEFLDKNDFLMPGAEELFDYLDSKGIITVLNSSNIIPVVEFFQKRLKISHVVGTPVNILEGKVESVDTEHIVSVQGKLDQSLPFLKGISAKETAAIGDGPADAAIFGYAGLSIAINPNGGAEKLVDHVIDDLSKAIAIIEDN